MPRSRGGPSRPSAPSRPTAPAPAPRSVAPQQQTRQMSTAPAQQQQQTRAPAQQSQGPGLFGQMASTAAGVAVGSSIGHAIGGFFGGGSSSQAPAQDAYAQPQQDLYNNTNNQAMDSGLYQANNSQATATGPCATDIKNFSSCMNQNNGDLNVCGWYLEQLKACQAAAKNY